VMTETITTSSGNKTSYASKGRWKKGEVWVLSLQPCPVTNHNLEVMHHNNDDWTHSCPTGFLWCPDCCGIANEPEPYECNRWDT